MLVVMFMKFCTLISVKFIHFCKLQVASISVQNASRAFADAIQDKSESRGETSRIGRLV